MKIIRIIVLALFAVISCNTNNTKPVVSTPITAPRKIIVDAVRVKYTASMVANKKDFACGMPVTAGIEDTCHYKGKVFGFCSKECMDEFLKKPESFLTAK